MLLLLSGVSLTLMGCLAGALLAWIPLSPTGQAPSLALWVLFPLFVLGGYVLAVMGARQAHWRGLTLGLGAVLLLLALSCAVGLLLQALGAWQPMAASAAKSGELASKAGHRASARRDTLNMMTSLLMVPCKIGVGKERLSSTRLPRQHYAEQQRIGDPPPRSNRRVELPKGVNSATAPGHHQDENINT